MPVEPRESNQPAGYRTVGGPVFVIDASCGLPSAISALLSSFDVAAALAQLTRIWLPGRQVEPMQWRASGLVVVFGCSTMLTQTAALHDGEADNRAPCRRGNVAARLDDGRSTAGRLAERGGTDDCGGGLRRPALLVTLSLTNLILALNFDFVT